MKKFLCLLNITMLFLLTGCLFDNHVHNFGEYEITKPATCLEEGMEVAYCTCGEKDTRVISKLGHNWSSILTYDNDNHFYECTHDGCVEKKNIVPHSYDVITIIEEATCSKEGLKSLKCSACGYTKTEKISILTEHPYESSWSSNDTHHWHKVTCYHDDQLVNYGEHIWGSWIVSKEPTLLEEGLKERTCIVCSYIDKQTISKLDSEHEHTFSSSWSSDDVYHWHDATCEHTDVYDGKEVHNYEVLETVQPTVYEEGYRLSTCKICGYNKEEVLPRIDSFAIIFVDKNDMNISERRYPMNILKSEIKVPNEETFAGMHFTGWIDINSLISFNLYDFDKIEVNDTLCFKASYEKEYTIVFKDYNGIQIGDTLTVYESNNKIAKSQCPTIPERMGYIASWIDSDLINIESSKSIYPYYEMITYTVLFKDIEGNQLGTIQTIPYGSFALEPEHDMYFLNKNEMKLYEFTKWDKDLTNIKEDMIINPIYDKPYDKPVIAMKIEDMENNCYKVGLSIIMANETDLLYNINLTFGWETENKTCEIIATSIKSSTALNTGYCQNNCTVGNDKNSWLTYNNKTKLFSFVWNCGNGHAINYTQDVISLTFEIDGGTVFSKDIFELTNDSSLIFGSSNMAIEDLIKITPMIWFYE